MAIIPRRRAAWARGAAAGMRLSLGVRPLPAVFQPLGERRVYRQVVVTGEGDDLARHDHDAVRQRERICSDSAAAPELEPHLQAAGAGLPASIVADSMSPLPVLLLTRRATDRVVPDPMIAVVGPIDHSTARSDW